MTVLPASARVEPRWTLAELLRDRPRHFDLDELVAATKIYALTTLDLCG